MEEFVVNTLSNMSKNRSFLSDKEKMIQHLKEEFSPNDSELKKQLSELKKQESNLSHRREMLLEKLEIR